MGAVRLLSYSMKRIGLPEFAALIGRSHSSVYYHARKGALGKAYDGKTVDVHHPTAQAFRERKWQQKSPQSERVPVPCFVCKTPVLRYAEVSSRKKRVFCSRACFSETRSSSRLCKSCGATFFYRDGDGLLYCSVECGARGSRHYDGGGRLVRWRVFGELYTMRELEAVTGLSKKNINDRVRRGMSIEEAILVPCLPPGPKVTERQPVVKEERALFVRTGRPACGTVAPARSREHDGCWQGIIRTRDGKKKRLPPFPESWDRTRAKAFTLQIQILERRRPVMVRNEREYAVTKMQIEAFETHLELLRRNPDMSLHERLRQLQIDAVESQLQDLREAIAKYEAERDDTSRA